MTSSPKKYASNFTSSTTNRGVEAKETEITNIHLDMNTSNSTQLRDERSRDSEPGAAHDDTATGSYIQVVVQKHRGGGDGRRVARASSPLRLAELTPAPAPADAAAALAGAGECGAGGVLVLPLLVSCTRAAAAGTGPAPAPLCACGARAPEGEGEGEGEPRGAAEGPVAPGPDAGAASARRPLCARFEPKKQRVSSWRKFGGFGGESPDSDDNEPECVEVYYFERSGGEYLATGEADRARLTALDRAARRCARRGGALLAELLAAPRLLVALPVGVLLAVERCALVTARGALAGGVQTLADYCTKPALALAFNALVHPPLVFVGNALRAAREALRPLWLALGDALEPAARLVAAVRPVHVQLAPCRCRAEPARRP